MDADGRLRSRLGGGVGARGARRSRQPDARQLSPHRGAHDGAPEGVSAAAPRPPVSPPLASPRLCLLQRHTALLFFLLLLFFLFISFFCGGFFFFSHGDVGFGFISWRVLIHEARGRRSLRRVGGLAFPAVWLVVRDLGFGSNR